MRAALSKAIGLLQRETEIIVEPAGSLQRQRLGEIPAQLMEIPDDGKHLEHQLCGVRGVPPALSAESDLGDPLPRAEAVVHRATPKTRLPEACVSSATEIRLQVRTRLPGGFVDREVRRGREGRSDAAQREAARAVSAQVGSISVRTGPR